VTDTITFEIPPRSTRLAGVAIVLAATVPVALALFVMSWFEAPYHSHTVAMQLMRVPDHPAMMPSGDTAYWLALIPLTLLALALVARLVFLAATIWVGRPLVRRGLFRSVLNVAWTTPVRAHLHVFLVLALSIFVVMRKPGLFLDVVEVVNVADVSRALGGFVMIGGLVLVHIALFAIAFSPQLAATQLWGGDDTATARPRRERPMIKPPAAAAPRVDGDPFRSPPRADIESKLVKPPAKPVEVPRADDPDAPPPKLLI
jgi:hypothetical protein